MANALSLSLAAQKILVPQEERGLYCAYRCTNIYPKMDLITPLASSCRVATPHDSVLNSECAYTFHTPYTTDAGIVVNLSTYVGTVDALALAGGADQGLFVRIVKKRVEKVKADKDDQGKDKPDATGGVTKLGVGIEGGFQSEEDEYDTVSTHSIVLLRRSGDSAPGVTAELPYNDATKDSFPTQVAMSADAIIHHAGLAVQQDLKAWELDDEPKPVSKYAESLPFVDNGVQISPDPSTWKCEKSGATDNLWLNLSTGFIGGGRKNWDGSGGSNGALDHYQETGEQYPLVVKLGTITEDIDTADCYSYAKDEDGPVKIPNLGDLLQKRGINVAGMQKTVKSTAELEVELNATYAFDAITESGSSLVPVSGPGLQGLQNLGNSCYLNSIVQMLLGGTVPELASRYGTKAGGDVAKHPLLDGVAPRDATNDTLVQTAKLSCALTSGAFAGPVPASATVTDAKSAATDPKYRLAPRMFKNLIGKDHVDFRTGQQQDAAQYLRYLFERLDRAELGAGTARLPSGGGDSVPVSSNLFAFKTETRSVCCIDSKIKYLQSAADTILNLRIPMEKGKIIPKSEEADRPPTPPDQKRQKSDEGKESEKKEEEVPTVTFKDCLDAWSASSTIDDVRWSHLGGAVASATAQVRFDNFPRYLIVQMNRYEMGADWTPKKIEVNIDMPQDIDLNSLKAKGPQDGEDLVPEEDEDSGTAAATSTQPSIDEGALVQLMDMGFSMNGCKRALTTVGGSDVEAAMNWIFEHNADPDFNDPIPEADASASAPAPGGGADGVDEATVMSLVENLGCFTADQVRAALKESNGAADRAADWLFSHMDDLDGAIAALASKNEGAAASSAGPSASATPLEDGSGKYTLVGLISHIGKNTGSGHYVAHLKKDGKWVIFNDEKVALSETPPFQHAYMYLFHRTDTVGSPNGSY